MNTKEEAEIKREFQLERVILFSDAVFAIIITIMVLDIRLPEEIRHATATEAKQAFARLIPKMLAYGLSFFLVSKFWRSHLKMFSLLKDYDNRLLTLNLLYLFSVSLFPFGVSLISGNLNLESPQFAWAGYTYVGVFLFCVLTQTILATYLMNHGHKLCYDTRSLDEVLKYKAIRLNFFFIPVILVLIAGLNYLAVQPVYSMYLLAVYGFTVSRILKRYYPEKDKNPAMLSGLFRPRRRKIANPETVGDAVAEK
jgi:uncharacterized membrane protein